MLQRIIGRSVRKIQFLVLIPLSIVFLVCFGKHVRFSLLGLGFGFLVAIARWLLVEITAPRYYGYKRRFAEGKAYLKREIVADRYILVSTLVLPLFDAFVFQGLVYLVTLWYTDNNTFSAIVVSSLSYSIWAFVTHDDSFIAFILRSIAGVFYVSPVVFGLGIVPVIVAQTCFNLLHGLIPPLFLPGDEY